jgi:hypothetical protein
MPVRVSTNRSIDTFGTVYESKPGWFNLIRHNVLPLRTSSEQSFHTVNKWLTQCLQNHGSSKKQHTSSLPKRVLQVQGHRVYLRETHGFEANYICLRHCWGKFGAALQLRKGRLDLFKNGIHKSHLPKTFEDAVDICSKLGVQFLWIDALCKYLVFQPQHHFAKL